MSAPTPETRSTVYERDHNRCVLCGAHNPLTFQHRQASGMGGRKARPTFVEGLCLCSDCNDRCERDLQTKALAYGVKVRRWVDDPADVPVLYPFIWGWARLTEDGMAIPISAKTAVEMMRAVYGEEWDAWMEEIRKERSNG